MKISYKDRISLPKNIEINVIWQKDEQVDVNAITNFVMSLKKPGWYTKQGDETRDTREYILNHPADFFSAVATTTDPFTNKSRLEWLCANCKCGTTYSGVDIGHKNDWRKELIAAGVLNNEEAKAVYNNLANLRIECGTCNRSHDWQ